MRTIEGELTLFVCFCYDNSNFFPIFATEMQRLLKIINKTLSVRISLMVVFAMAILLMASLVIMLYFSRKAVKEEALHKASETLESVVQRIDNILLSVEQTTGNFYFNMVPDLNSPDMMYTFATKLVETNPYVAGCAIAFREDYFPGHKYFMAYVHHADSGGVAYSGREIVRESVFGSIPYYKQVWFTKPMATFKPQWLNPLAGMESDEVPILTFSLPLPGIDGQPIGVIGVDVSLSDLSQIVAEAKPSPNSYCTLIDKDGVYIVHPNTQKLLQQTTVVLTGNEDDASAREAARAMTAGETGYRPFHLNGNDYYVFFKPFERNAVSGRDIEKLKWSAGIIYPEDDIFGDYNSLTYYVLIIAFVGLLLMFLLSRTVIHRQLQPLYMLTEQAQRIAKGHYDEPIPSSRHKDEIGRLQDNFRLMQQSLATNIGEMDQLKATLQERSKVLQAAYTKAKKADRMKTAFLHNMTNQMLAPAESISKDVEALGSLGSTANAESIAWMVDDIQQSGDTIAEVLKNLLNISDEEKEPEEGKEVTHV